MNCNVQTNIYIISHISVEALTTGQMTPSVTNSPPACKVIGHKRENYQLRKFDSYLWQNDID